jgi:transcriptional regulator with XRE-family HTH domain
MTDRLFPALLKYWRGRRGLSQLDLALAAEVSARHISFLESGRARPSAEMVLRLLHTLDLPLRTQNEGLRAAGFEPRFGEAGPETIPPEIDHAIVRMMAQQEPFPLTVLSGAYQIVEANESARRVFRLFTGDDARRDEPAADMFELVFDPGRLRPFVANWPQLARGMLARLHREVLQAPLDQRLSALLARALRYPEVPPEWRRPDFAEELGGTLAVRLRRGDLDLSFLTTVTTFSAPRAVAVEELRIESAFPLDERTRLGCEDLAKASSSGARLPDGSPVRGRGPDVAPNLRPQGAQSGASGEGVKTPDRKHP